MKILMLTPYLPYPLFSGGQIRSYNIIKQLSSQHRITLFSLIRRDEEREYIAELEKYCSKVTVFKRKKAFQLDNILLAAFTSWPFILHVYDNPKLKEALRVELEKESYDLIHAETFYVMHDIPKIRLPIVLFEQNIEYDVYQRIAAYFEPSFVRPLLLFDVFKMKKWEEHFWKKINALVVMSNLDKEFVNRNAFVCGNGVDTDEYKLEVRSKRLEVEKRILFIGNFKWFENRDAVSWILKDIWPKLKLEVRSKKLEIKLWIVGRKIPGSIKRLTSDPNVFFDENAPDNTREIYQQASVLLAPLRAGGGTSFKVLEAMATGLPVVTTPLVEKTLSAKDGEELLVGENTEELAKRLLQVLEDENLYNRIANNARKLVEEKYDWKILVKQIEEIYEQVVE